MKIPRRGDIVWLNFDPQDGHEQAGRRPGLILSPEAYNARSHFALVCPITSKQKGYPFEVPIPAGLVVSGVIIADQVRSLDLLARRAEFVCNLDSALVAQVLDLIGLLVSPD